MRRLALFVGLLLCASSAQAASVNYNMLLNPLGSYQVFATSSAGDNAGIANFAFALNGVTTVENVSPFVAVDQNIFLPRGFSELRGSNASSIGAGQSLTATPAQIVYGFGQTDSFLTPLNPAVPQAQPDYGVPLLLAQGTWNPATTAPSFGQAVAVVYNTLGQTGTSTSGVTTSVTAVPEPSTLALGLAAGIVGLIAIRRRKQA